MGVAHTDVQAPLSRGKRATWNLDLTEFRDCGSLSPTTRPLFKTDAPGGRVPPTSKCKATLEVALSVSFRSFLM